MPAHPLIDMTGVRVGGFVVVEKAPTKWNHACWWLACDACKEQRFEKGSSLRRAQAGRYTVWCRKCGAGEPQ